MVKIWANFAQITNIVYPVMAKWQISLMSSTFFGKKFINFGQIYPIYGNFWLLENRFSSILKPGFGFEFKTGIPVFKTDFGLTTPRFLLTYFKLQA